MKISLVQLTSVDCLQTNAQQIKESISSLSDSDLVVLPENSLFMKLNSEPIDLDFEINHSIFNELKEICKKNNYSLLLTTPIKENGQIANATILVTADKAEVVYRKIHLFDVDVEGEKPISESRQFTAGTEPKVLDINGWKCGLSICYDIRFAELYSYYAKEAVDIIFAPSAFLVPTGEAHWHILLRARAIESQAYIVAPGQAGEHKSEQGVRNTYGHSLIVNPWGEVVADLEDKVGVVTVELDRKKIEQVRKQIPMDQHRRM